MVFLWAIPQWLWEDYANSPGFRGRSCLPGETDEAQEQELHKIILYAHKKAIKWGFMQPVIALLMFH